VVHDIGISPEAFMATDVIITVGTTKERKTGTQTRQVNEFVATSNRKGVFSDLSDIKKAIRTPVLQRALTTCGLTESEAEEEIMARGEIRRYLAEAGRDDPQYLGPEWVCISNEYIDRNAGKTCEALVGGFRQKYPVGNRGGETQ
jgi:hypothetical protein